MILMQYRRDLRIHFGSGLHETKEKSVICVGARSATGLNDDGRPGFTRRFHDRLDLFHVVDVERPNTVATFGGFIKYLIQAAIEAYPKIPLVMHQDHGQSPDVCRGAIDLGFSSVMMDGSLESDGKTIASYEYNVQVTKQVVDMAHRLGVSVEGELGCLGSLETMRGDKEDGHGTDATMTRDMLLTDPEQAADFVKKTGVDALAIAIGTSHGVYKFTQAPTGETLKMERLIEIHKKLPKIHLVMHGSSSVPKELQDIINRYGGKLKPTWGVPVQEIQLGIKNGVRKINVDTDNRLAMTGAIRKVFAEHPEEFDPRSYLKPAREAMKKLIAQRMAEFGQAGHAGDYKPIPLSEMAKRYARETSSRRVA